jgi:hypothetical protein
MAEPRAVAADRDPRWAWGGWCLAAAGVFAVSAWLALFPGVLPPAGEGIAAVVAVAGIVADALPVLAAWWVAAAGYGGLLRLKGSASVACGMAWILVLLYVLGLTVGVSGAVAWAVLGAGILLALFRFGSWLRRPDAGERPRPRPAPSYAWLIGVPGLGFLVVAACCPPGTIWAVEAFGYDATSYHLQIAREWVNAGAMVELPHNVYAYLPGLMELAYAATFALRGGDPVASVYACQLLHASFAVVAALALAGTLKGRVKLPGAAVLPGAVVLIVPWVIVTGSLAYNEVAVLGFAAAGLRLILGPERPRRRSAAAVGLLAGAATLAKLTAGFTVALPLGLLLVWRMQRETSIRRTVMAALLCAAVGTAALSPYLIRNAAWTGNPVFPFAATVFGTGHWDADRAERWNIAHRTDATLNDRLKALWRQALGNAGYATLGGNPSPRETQNVARFRTEGGFPTLWLFAAGGLTVGLIRREGRWFAAAAALLLLWQFAWWLTMTHLQSRFLIVAVLPLGLAVGLAVDQLARVPGGWGRRLSLGATAGLGVLLAVAGLTVLWSQTTRLTLPDGSRTAAPPWLLVDGLPAPHGRGVLQPPPVNVLPRDRRVAVVGNNQGLFYLEPELVYASAFDASPITAMLDGPLNSQAFAAALRNRGVTHLWLGYSELDRLHATYGFDAGVTTARLRHLVQHWPHLTPPDAPSVLVRVPKTPTVAP